MNYLIIIFWILSLVISTSFIAFYVRKYQKSEVIIAIYVLYIALSQILAAKLAVFWEFTAPAAVIIFPFTFQLTDTMNEHFGQKETHRMIFIAFITQILFVIFIWFGNSLEPAGIWWIDNSQWLMIFQQSIGITAASWISYLLTENMDAWLYQKIMKWTKGKMLWVRSCLSDIPMLALDSVIFVSLAFGVFGGNWAIVPATMLGQMVTKWIFGVIDTPFMYLDRFIVNYKKKSPLAETVE
ncbi:queuosine precursor transporter [Candidatus Lokiarchaeum ossiferum]|uniref:queuosine precursor transporter n=1 Tax=Candidatus Lokiarchaeum ossiferum TaxID=2951803 RepID=UPI00352E8A7D